MNDQDPLAQLRDIHMPDPVSWWPPALGWWVLAALLLAGLVIGIWLLLRQRANNAYRRTAQRELIQAWATFQQDSNSSLYLQTLNQVLRRSALAAYPRHQVSGMHGEAWLEFLDDTLVPSRRSGEAAPFSQGAGRHLLVLPYRPVPPDVDLQPMHELVLRWLAQHGKPQVRPTAPARTPEGYRAAI